MLKKLFAAIGLGSAAAAAPGKAAVAIYSPYTSESSNVIYNLLFCDDLAAFKVKPGASPTHWHQVLFSEPGDVAALEALAADVNQEGRIRYLAFSKLRGLGKSVPPKISLGVIVEVPLAGGLDTLAAFSEGGVRYINQSGKLVVIEGVENFSLMVKRLFAASEPLVARIGPWDKPRLAPPKQSNVRLTFLVSDGMYFGEGPMLVMEHEALAGPVIHCATALLQAVVATGTAPVAARNMDQPNKSDADWQPSPAQSEEINRFCNGWQLIAGQVFSMKQQGKPRSQSPGTNQLYERIADEIYSPDSSITSQEMARAFAHQLCLPLIRDIIRNR